MIEELSFAEQERYRYLAEEFVDIYTHDKNAAAAWLYGQVTEDEWEIIKQFNREEFIRRGWKFPNDGE